MRIYLSGKWEDRARCQFYMKLLRNAGHEITVDWTDHKYEDENYPKEYCSDDVKGVREAEAYIGVFIEKEYKYRGALVEFGIALGQGKKCYFIGHAQDSCIFRHHPLVQTFESISDIIKELQ